MPYTANKKPSGLDAASSVAGTDVLVIEKSGSVQRATAADVAAYAFSTKGTTITSPNGSEVLVARDGATLKDIALNNIVPGGNITNAKVSSNTADRIDGNKIAPNFGSQTVQTTGQVSAGSVAVTGNTTMGGTLVVTGALTANGGINATVTGTSSSANQLTTTRNIAATGDVAWNVNFNGSADVTAAATIQNNVVTDAKLRTGVACSVVGRSANTTGNVADISAAADDRVLRRAAGALGFGQVATNMVEDSAVTFAKMQSSAAAGLSVIGRSAASAGAFAEINAASDNHVLRRSGSSVGFGQVTADGIAIDAVTTLKINGLAVTDAKLATGAVTGAPGGGKLAASAITLQTQKTSIAAGDEFLIHSSADSALRRVAWSALQPTGSVVKKEIFEGAGGSRVGNGTSYGTATFATSFDGATSIASLSYTPTSASNYLIATAVIHDIYTASSAYRTRFFVGTSSHNQSSTVMTNATYSDGAGVVAVKRIPLASASPLTIEVKVINQGSAANSIAWGTVTIIVEEIKV